MMQNELQTEMVTGVVYCFLEGRLVTTSGRSRPQTDVWPSDNPRPAHNNLDCC